MQAVNLILFVVTLFHLLVSCFYIIDILVGYMFYENIVIILVQQHNLSFTGSGGQKLYYNLGLWLNKICYTCFPIIVLGVFDYDVRFELSRLSRDQCNLDHDQIIYFII